MAESDSSQEIGEQTRPVEPGPSSTTATWQMPIGRFDAYDPATEEWDIYQERIEQFMDANGIPSQDEHRRRAVLLNSCDKTTYHLIRNLVSPARPAATAYSTICQKVSQHFNPKPTVTVQRYKFNTRSQEQGEDIATFVSKLRELAGYCEFEEELNDHLRDRLVCGVAEERIKRRLFTEPTLTFQRALEIARNMETANKNVAAVTSSGSLTATSTAIAHKVQSPRSRSTQACFRCGGTNHTPAKCYFKNSECHHCHVRDHIAKACRKKGTQLSGGKPERGKQKHSAKCIQGDSTSGSESDREPEETFYVKKTTDKEKSKPIMVNVEADGQNLSMELDTGTSVSLISEKTYLSAWTEAERPPLHCSNKKLRTYTGESIPVMGEIRVNVRTTSSEPTVQLPLLVVEKKGCSLLGRDWLNQLRFNWHQIFSVSSAKLDGVLEKHRTVFGDDLGEYKGPPTRIIVDPSEPPHFFLQGQIYPICITGSRR